MCHEKRKGGGAQEASLEGGRGRKFVHKKEASVSQKQVKVCRRLLSVAGRWDSERVRDAKDTKRMGSRKMQTARTAVLLESACMIGQQGACSEGGAGEGRRTMRGPEKKKE